MAEDKIKFFKIVEELSCVKELAGAYVNQNNWFSLCRTIEYLNSVMHDLIEMSKYEPTEKEYELIRIEAQKKLGEYMGMPFTTTDELQQA